MLIEVPFSIQEPFRTNPVGKEFMYFAREVYKLNDGYFPIHLRVASKFLVFANPLNGVDLMKRWQEVGILRLPADNKLPKRELVVVKLTQYYGWKLKNYGTVYEALQQSLRGSGLEDLLGEFQPKAASIRSLVSVIEPYEDENGHWWYDAESLVDRPPNWPSRR